MGVATTVVKIPAKVRDEARKAFVLRDQFGYKGATATGWARAAQLANDDAVPLADLRVMRNWYARHIYVSKPGYDEWRRERNPNNKMHERAVIAWLTWGGDAGLVFVNAHTDLLNRRYNKMYEKIKQKK